MPKETKEDFHEQLDISNPKAKLRALMENSDYMIKVYLLNINIINFNE